MQYLKSGLAAFVLSSSLAMPSVAQDGDITPSELPPEGYAQATFVDSQGCAFTRAGVGGVVQWLPRFTADRQQICNQTPSVAPKPVVETTAPTAPVVSAAPAQVTAPKPQRSVRTPVRTAPKPQPLTPVELAQQADACKGRVIESATAQDDGRILVRCGKAPAIAQDEAIARAQSAGACSGSSIASARVIEGNKIAVRCAATPSGQAQFVQVGVYAVPSNAARAQAQLADLGFAVQTHPLPLRGQPAARIVAGPFSSARELNSALMAVRKAGYRDAFRR